MKIKITENQAMRLKLLTENLNPLTQFEHLCKMKLQDVNHWYTKVSSISITDIVNKTVNMAEINSALDTIENEIRIGNRKAYAFIDGLSEEDLDIRIDRADDMVIGKLTSLQLLTMDLESLQNSCEEHKLAQQFNQK